MRAGFYGWLVAITLAAGVCSENWLISSVSSAVLFIAAIHAGFQAANMKATRGELDMHIAVDAVMGIAITAALVFFGHYATAIATSVLTICDLTKPQNKEPHGD